MKRNFFFSKLKYGLLIYLLNVCFLSLQAQNTKLLSLEEAVKLGLNHDLQAKVDAAQIGILQSKVNQNKKSILPDIALNLNYTRISDNITPFTVSFPTGDVTLNPQILNQSYNSIQLKQLIWNGGKVNYGIEISKKELEVSKLDLEKSKLNTVYNISALWYNAYVLKTSKQIIEANIASLLQSQKDVNNLVKQGVTLQNEALKIDLAITNLQSNLIDISSSINALNFNLCTLIGLPTSTVLDLPELSETDNLLVNKIEDYIAVALANRTEIKSINTYKQIADIGLELSKSNYLPTVSAIGSGNYNLPEQRLFPNENKFTPTWFMGINLNWAISSLYKNPEKINESKQTVTKTEALYNQAREGITMEVNAAFTEYLQATQKIVVAKKAVEQSTENYRVEQNQLTASVITTTDFLEANNKLLQSKLNLNAAKANAQLALKKLNKTIGQ